MQSQLRTKSGVAFLSTIIVLSATSILTTSILASSANYAAGKCSSSSGAISNVTSVQLNQGETLNICAKFFYYDSPKLSVFVPKDAITILTYHNVPGTNATHLVLATSDFAITATETYVSTLTTLLGLSPNVGIISPLGDYVFFTITPTSEAKSHLYFIQPQGFSYPEMIQCQDVMELAVGNATAVPAGFPCLYISNSEAIGTLANQIVWASTNSSES